MALFLYVIGFLSFGLYWWTGDIKVMHWAMFFYLAGALEEIKNK